MKKIICLCLIFFSIEKNYAQDVDSLAFGDLKLNFVVPDMPAFKALGTEPSTILRPSTPKALAVSLSEFYDAQKIVLPKAFAMEVSPALLWNANKKEVELKKYRERACINSFRLSLGTSSDTSISPSGRVMALVLNIKQIWHEDLTTDNS